MSRNRDCTEKKWKNSCLFGGFFKNGYTVYIKNFGDERGGTGSALEKNSKGRNGKSWRESGRGGMPDKSGMRLFPNSYDLQLTLCLF